MAAPDTVKKLVDDFERLKGGPPPESFDEAQLRVSYINPFWEALSWNVRDPGEVVIEKVVPMRHSTKRADYCFQLNGRPAFVLEAKDFRKRLDDADVVFQLNRYGYNIPVDFGFLTNFAELQLYETWKPPLIENPVKNRVKKFHFEYPEYVERWDELAAALARDAVAAGALDEFLTKKEPTRNKEALDRKFFEGLNEWRAELARVIALRNPDLSVHDINEAVQRILDRCIFMRVIEDREIEATELLLDALNRWTREKEKKLYRYVVDKFRYLEPQYNGELFDRHELSEELIIDDRPLKEFIESLYYPKCPYQFNVVGVEMLGTIYERFLGSTVRLTPSHRAVVEEKPEVRKAGGVYYTPKYIVDYIVENTVGELLGKCKTPAAVAKLKILDPACGSGSFLLGAFQRLIDWHEDYFNATPEKISKGPAAECWWDGEAERWRVTAKFKGRILVNNIFGVDIDTQACEVTRMSLYLKILESVNVQYLMKTALLPQLDSNIKCGNSLIGSDYWDFVRGRVGAKAVGANGHSPLPFEITEDERRRVNPFDWDVEFAVIMKAGGFDAVIANPPWVDIKGLYELFVDYYFVKYSTTSNRINVYAIFLEKGLTLLKDNGNLGFIIPNSILFQTSYEKLRVQILRDFSITNIARMPDKVFGTVKAESVIITLKKKKPGLSGKTEVIIFGKDLILLSFDRGAADEIKQINQTTWGDQEYSAFNIFMSEEEQRLTRKIEAGKAKLEELCDFTLGITPYDKYKGHTKSQIKNKAFHANRKLSDAYGKLLAGGDVTRYLLEWNGEMWLKYGPWLGAPREERFFINKRILIRQIVSGKPPRIMAAITDDPYYNTQTIFNIILKPRIEEDAKYILGIINSQLINFYHTNKFLDKSKDLFQKILIQNTKLFPIREVDFSDANDVARHDKMVALVEEMLELHKRHAAAKSDADKKRIQRAVDAADRKIDALVYELYGLTDEEIKIVEGA